MKNFILNNLGLKLLALLLAIATWYYIVVELHRGAVEESVALQTLLPYKMVSKQVPIKLNLAGEPPKGRMVLYDKIVIEPPTCVIIGPKLLLKSLTLVMTQPIDLSGHATTFTKGVSVVSPFEGITMREKFVNVTIPIAEIKE